MNDVLPPFHADDLARRAHLSRVLDLADAFWHGLGHRAAGDLPWAPVAYPLASTGADLDAVLTRFASQYLPHLSGSAGGRYWGFVTGGGSVPAVAGDWLVAAVDQNATSGITAAAALERETLAQLRTLFGLPDSLDGSFVSGATLSNFVGLAIGRQWAGQRHGVDVARQGVVALPGLAVLSGCAHASVVKSLAMLGLGRDSLRPVALLPGREAVDIAALEAALAERAGQPTLVVANAGTVNTTDFDDIAAMAALKVRYEFWLHVDAAFGAFAACAPETAPLLAGWAEADSICIDLHKWLNVPYDSAIQLTRHRALQLATFLNQAAYLGDIGTQPDYVHLTPENSRRWRALPAWMTLNTYGADGYRVLVRHCCAMARRLADHIDRSEPFRLLAPPRLNVVCFTLGAGDPAPVGELQARVNAGGEVYVTPTRYQGVSAIRAAFCNWRTTEADVERGWQALLQAAQSLADG